MQLTPLDTSFNPLTGYPWADVTTLAVCRLSPTSVLLAVGTQDEHLRLIALDAGGAPLGSTAIALDAVPTWIGIDPANGPAIHVGTDAGYLYTLQTGHPTQRLKMGDWITDGVILPDGRVVVTCDDPAGERPPTVVVRHPDGTSTSIVPVDVDAGLPFVHITSTPTPGEVLVGTGVSLAYGVAVDSKDDLWPHAFSASDWLGWMPTATEPILVAASIAGVVITTSAALEPIDQESRPPWAGLFGGVIVPDHQLLMLVTGGSIEIYRIGTTSDEVGSIELRGIALQIKRGTQTCIDATPDGAVIAIGGGTPDGEGFVNLYRLDPDDESDPDESDDATPDGTAFDRFFRLDPDDDESDDESDDDA